MNPLLKLREFWEALDGRQRTRIVVAAVGTIATLWLFVMFANRVRYEVLATRLSPEDSLAIINELKAADVPYRLRSGGSVIEVPSEQVDDLSINFAGKGLMAHGGDGFDLFDQSSLGESSFTLNVRYQRALEEKLARTVESLASVAKARVHLAIPEESLFLDEDEPVTASVAIELRRGAGVGKEQVQAIANLVASGVERLSPENVAVVDLAGRLLHSRDDGPLSNSQDDAKRTAERRIEKQLIDLIEPIVGRGKVRARATVELKLTQIERVEERYDPDGAVVRSEQKSKAKGGGSAPAGIPGAQANLGGGGAAGTQDSESSNTLTNFEINKTVSTIREPVGTISRQSIAVAIDHAPPTDGDDAAGEGGAAADSQPRSPEEMRKIEELVRAAIGFDEDRGDTVIVSNVPFAPVEPIEEGLDLMALLPLLMRYGSLLLAILVLVLFVVRPGMQVMKSLGAPPSATPALAGAGAGADGALQTVGEAESELESAAAGIEISAVSTPLQERLIQAIREDPQTAALVVRSWIEEEDEDE